MNTLKRTNTNEYKNRIQSYLLAAICTEGTPLESVELTDRNKIEFFFATFESEYSFEKLRTPNTQARLAGYLQGLPSCIDIPFMNGQILKFAAQMHGIDQVPENKEFVILENYWNHIAFNLLGMYQKLTGESYKG